MCLLPGGFGTLDEGLEVLTLLQTGKRDMTPVVFLDEPGGDFWASFQQFVVDKLLGRGMISEEDLSLLKLTDSVDEAVAEILGFFRVYHSMRFVHKQLVLRLAEPVGDELLERLNERFCDILLGGRIERSDALPEERDDPELLELPRLAMRFNRRNYGRLRQLIDCLNQGRCD